jgi:hypothetical protein
MRAYQNWTTDTANNVSYVDDKPQLIELPNGEMIHPALAFIKNLADKIHIAL